MERKGYIFDYGGTLDTAGQHWGKVIWHGYERQQTPVNEEQYRKAYVYAERMLGRQPIIQPDYSFRKTLDIKLRIQFDYLQEKGYLCSGDFNITRMRMAILDDLYRKVEQTTHDSRGVLQQLHKEYPLVLVTNFYGNMPVVLQEFQLDNLFTKIVESAVVGVRKPDARIFMMGVEALGLHPAEVTVVGDSIEKDIIPAKSIGCHTVWLKGEGWTDVPADSHAADKTIAALEEILH